MIWYDSFEYKEEKNWHTNNAQKKYKKITYLKGPFTSRQNCIFSTLREFLVGLLRNITIFVWKIFYGFVDIQYSIMNALFTTYVYKIFTVTSGIFWKKIE